MPAIPEPWEAWFSRLAEVLTALQELSVRQNSRILLAAPVDVLTADGLPELAARDEWVSLIKQCLHETQVEHDHGFEVFHGLRVLAELFGAVQIAAPREFPVERLTDLYLTLLQLYKELESVSPLMALSFSAVSPSTLIEEVPSTWLLQDLLICVGQSVPLTRPQALLALELDPAMASLVDGALNLIKQGLSFYAASLSCPLGLAWDSYMNDVEAEERMIQRQAANHSINIRRLDSSFLEQALVWSYLADDQLPEAISILIHLLRNHQHDSECEREYEVGPEDWAKWLAESIRLLAAKGEEADSLLINIAGFADMDSIVAADREEGHRLRVRERLGDMWADLHHVTRMRLEQSEKERARARALRSSDDPAASAFHIGLFAEHIYAAIENETKQRLDLDQLRPLDSNLTRLSVSLQKVTVQGFIIDCGGDSGELRRLLDHPLMKWLRRCRNASTHHGTSQVQLEEADKAYDALWGLRGERPGWLLKYFSALPPSSAQGQTILD